ncbi:hypothetical protein [Albimonas donghaensis]|uniref:hypothetical protein n=1 Tax=Albimonas donghaensis TaxID=356660 RepID=UPI000B87EC46|nr:hypothetical protein [Albimonas donghaensis]
MLAVLILTLTSVAGWLSWRQFERPSGAFLTARLDGRGRRERPNAWLPARLARPTPGSPHA